MSKLKLCLEDLSNEIFMEMFDYLYGQQIYSSFFNLNHRFNLLCDYYPKLYIDTTDPSLNRKKFDRLRNSILSKHIHCLKFSADKWISQISAKYCSSLHSLIFINSTNPTKIKEFLEKLPLHNQLHYLFIHIKLCESDIQDLVTTIFKLPNLIRLEFDVDRIKLDFVRIDQPLLSLRHFSIDCYEWDYFLQLLPFMPNLISLNLSSKVYNHSRFIFIQPNSLSKLKTLRMNHVHTYREINYIFRLCLQLKIFQVQFSQIVNFRSMIKAKDWEELLIPMKFLRKIEILVYGISDTNVIDLSEYDTNFWIQRNLKARLTTYSTFSVSNNQTTQVDTYGPVPAGKLEEKPEHGSRSTVPEDYNRSCPFPTRLRWKRGKAGPKRGIAGLQIRAPYSCFQNRPFSGIFWQIPAGNLREQATGIIDMGILLIE